MIESEQILMSVLNCRRIDLHVDRKPLSAGQEKQYQEMLAKRAAGQPLQYLIGHCDFMGIKILVDPRVLIPRPETEILVDLAIQKIKTFGLIKILDLGTGSGNIAIALAKNIPFAHVTTDDISKDALELAQLNAQENQVEDRLTFVQQDMKDYLEDSAQEKFDLIISNPPYIPAAKIVDLPADVQQEPHLALNGGKDGLDFYRVIVQQAHKHLRDGGYLFLEIGDHQDRNLKELLTGHGSYENIRFEKDYRNTNRIVWTKKINTNIKSSESETNSNVSNSNDQNV